MGVRSPYKLYPVQKQIMKDLISWWKTDKKHVLLQSPTGSGKTLLLEMFALLKIKNYRFIYFSREHAQIEQCTLELKQLVNLNKDKEIKAVHIAGKSSSCLHNFVKTITDMDEQQIACDEFTAAVCGYHSQLKRKSNIDEGQVFVLDDDFKQEFYEYEFGDDKSRLIELDMVYAVNEIDIMKELFDDSIADNKKIMKIAKKYSMCPRTLQKMAMEEANIIFAPYNYMVIPRFNANSENDVYIIDESHNLDVNLTSMFTNRISNRTFSTYFNHIRKNNDLNYLMKYNSVLNPLLEFNKVDTEYFIQNKDMEKLLDEIDTDMLYDLSEILDEIIKYNKIKKKHGASKNNIPKFFLSINRYLSSIKKLKENIKSGFISFSYNSYEIKFVNTVDIFKDISEMASRIIIASGSLYPKHMASYLGLNKFNTKIYEYDPPHKNIKRIAETIGTYDGIVMNTQYSNRKEIVYKSYANIIAEIYKENEHGTLVYFTSYSYRDKVNEYLLEDHNIISYLPESIDAFKAKIKKGNRAIFSSAFRGLGSEGWNLGDDMSRAIILCGIPYLPIKDITVRSQMEYYNSKKMGLGQQWYNQKAALWLMQTLGRGIRHMYDYTTVYIVDSRINKLRTFFLKWVKSGTDWKMKEWKNGRRKIYKE